MTATLVLSPNCTLNRNTGTYGTPTWSACNLVHNLKLKLSKTESDVSTRGNGGYEATKGVLHKIEVEYDMPYDLSDTNLAAILTAYNAGTGLDMCILDGASTVASGSQGPRASFEILEFERDESLPEAVKANIKMKPTYAANGPSWLGPL